MTRLQWLDTHEGYGLLSRLLHWAMAALLGWQFLGMACKLILGRVPLSAFFVGTHAPLGLVLCVLIVLRLGWALINRRRRPPHAAGRLGTASRLGHLALYGLMLLVPVLALLRHYGSGRAFEPFGLPLIAATPDSKLETLVRLGDALHGELAWLLLALIAGHVLMVLVHRFCWRDGVAARMLGPLRRSDRPAA